MAHLLRVVACLLLLVWGHHARADFAPKPRFTVLSPCAFETLGPFTSMASACSAFATAAGSCIAGTSYTSSVASGGCVVTRDDGAKLYPEISETSPSCPANSTQQGGMCACQSGFVESGGECRPANPCPAGQHEEGGACVPDKCGPDEIRVNGVCVKEPPCPPGETRVNGVCKKNGCEPGKSVGDYETNGQATSYYCEPYGGKNCMVRVNPSVCVTHDGHTSCWGTGRMTGATCSPGSSSPGGGDGSGPGGDGSGGGDGPGSGPGNGPGNGDGPGSGDGDGPGTGPVQPPVAPVPPVPPDPNTGQCPPGTNRYSNGNCYPPTPSPTDPGDDGECPPGTVKVRSKCVFPSPPGKPVPDTGTPENPNPGGGDGDGDGEDDGGSNFNGSCMGGFTCEGDAIQCAIAREQHRRACKLFDDESPESKLYNQHKGKEGNQTGDLPGNETISITGRINTSDAIGGGGCFGDLNLTVWHTSVSLPLSSLCQYLAMLGNILVAVSMLMAARIITRG